MQRSQRFTTIQETAGKASFEERHWQWSSSCQEKFQ